MRMFRSDENDEVDDSTLNRILIVTQTPPAFRKHPGGDRTGDYQPRAKITADLAKQINDGLQMYEVELFELEEQQSRMVSLRTPFLQKFLGCSWLLIPLNW